MTRHAGGRPRVTGPGSMAHHRGPGRKKGTALPGPGGARALVTPPEEFAAVPRPACIPQGAPRGCYPNALMLSYGFPELDRFHARAGLGADAEPDGVRRRDPAGRPGSPGGRRSRLAVRGDRPGLNRALRQQDRLLQVSQGRRHQVPVARAGRPGRLRAAGRRRRVVRPGMAGTGPGRRDAAAGLGPAVPPRRRGGALAGGQGPPARRTAAGQPV